MVGDVGDAAAGAQRMFLGYILDLQFVAQAPPGAQIVVSDESVDLRWWPIDALPTNSDDALAYLVARAAHTSLE